MGGIRGRCGPAAVATVAICGALAPAAAGGALAQSAARLKTVRYHGVTLRIPRSWPVFELSRAPGTCVRFDRHALYLGVPGSEQRCPARAVGRTEAILVSPLRSGQTVDSAAALGLEGNVASFAVPRAGVEVTATWWRAPAVVARALRRGSLRPIGLPAPSSTGRPAHAGAAGARSSSAHKRPARKHGPVIFKGSGFDTCTAPSTGQMGAWKASRYRAIGVYIGGVNMACSQANLSRRWLISEMATGWHLAPLYVGPIAPGDSSCPDCVHIQPGRASAQGAAAASDAVRHARALGFRAGTPIYYDGEAYRDTARTRSLVLTFLRAWTTRLRADGFTAGVYGGTNSLVKDVVSVYGSRYPEPSDLWIAHWDDRPGTGDPTVPRRDWAHHRRLRQWMGPHNETHGGVTLNIDSDSLNGATAYAPPLDGYLILTSDGGVHPYGKAAWYGSDLGKLPRGVHAVALAKDRLTGGYWVLKSNGGVDGFHAPREGSLKGKLRGRRPVALAATREHGYLILTGNGDVRAFGGGRSHGSDAGMLPRRVRAVALAVDPKTGGYWILRSDGAVDAFDAPSEGSLRGKLDGSRAVALAATPRGGYLILTSKGRVHPFGTATSYGSDAGRLPRGVMAVALATPQTGPGYRILRSDGGVDGFHAPWYGSLRGALARGTRPEALAATGG